jgi:hypothetical protein
VPSGKATYFVTDVNEIVKHHALLENDLFNNIFHNFNGIATDPPGNAWEKPSFDGVAVFFAYSKAKGYIRAARKSGRPSPVVLIKDSEFTNSKKDLLYISWKESWKKNKIHTRNFELLDTGITFYWGNREFPGKVEDQLFRAEWTQRREGSSVLAAHPHWHIDWPLGMDLDKMIDGVHLGMAGWDLAEQGETHEYWIKYVQNSLYDLRLWVNRVIKYGIQQFDEYIW